MSPERETSVGGPPAARPRRKPPDFAIFLATVGLVGIGIVMVFSSSYVKADQIYGDPYYFLKRQATWAALGLTAMLVTMNYDYWRLRRLARPMMVMAVLLLVIVLIPGVGREAGGARRWIGFGPLQFQPTEFAKLAMVVFLSAHLTERGRRIKTFTGGVLPYLMLLAPMAALILLEPDLGTAVAIAATTFLMLFTAGARLSHLILTGILALPAVAYAIWAEEYRLRRILAFLDPWQDPQGAGFHIIQALYAIGSGGFFGLGLGQSRQKFYYLPEQHTDFIFAILGEELGFLGATCVLALFFFVAWRGYRVAIAAPEPFAALLAAGVTSMVMLQAVINIGVVTSTLPITGIPLPFLSFGGSSLFFMLTGMGMLLNVSRYAES